MHEVSQRNQKLESLGILAGGIAHDFNNLMGGIFGYIDLAIQDSADEKVTSYLSKSLNTIDRARSLTQQLLTFSKGGAPVLTSTNLFPLIQETVQFSLSGSNVTCIYEIDQNLSPCIIDKNQLCQVIDNLTINAQQSMPMGGAIELTAKNISISGIDNPVIKQGNYVKISIKDYGIGISKKIISNIFDPFYTTKFKGQGLGLATCFSIINRHGGTIEVDSVIEKGSTFHVYLPASSEPVSVEIEKKINHNGAGRIVVMDDQSVILETTGIMLKSFGYTVVSKTNGKDTLKFFTEEMKRKGRIAAFIIDLTIPGGIGGTEVASAIRKTGSKIPIFASSGYADDPVMKNPEKFGFASAISKPFTKNELAEMLENYFRKSKPVNLKTRKADGKVSSKKRR